MKPQAYFEKDGSYNERRYVKPKPRRWELVLNFDRTMESQLSKVMLPEDIEKMETMRDAYLSLREKGCFPGNHGRRMEKQITMKGEQFIKRFIKAFTV